MRLRLLTAVATFALVAPAGLGAQDAFEGVISMAMMAGKGQPPMDVLQMVKGARSRTEMKAGSGVMVMITDMAARRITTLMPEQKMYMTWDMDKMGQMAQGLPGMPGGGRKASRSGPVEVPKITATGRTETIAGRTCEHFVMGDKDPVDVCAAKGLGYFGMGGGGPMGGRMGAGGLGAALPPGWSDAVKAYADGFFPLKLERLDGDKRETMMQVKSIEPKTLEEALFVPPPDYKEMKMPSLPFGRPQQ